MLMNSPTTGMHAVATVTRPKTAEVLSCHLSEVSFLRVSSLTAFVSTFIIAPCASNFSAASSASAATCGSLVWMATCAKNAKSPLTF